MKNIKEKILNKIKTSKIISTKQRRINTLELEIDTLKSIIKDELYKDFYKSINESLELENLREESDRLRIKIKDLRETIKELNSKINEMS